MSTESVSAAYDGPIGRRIAALLQDDRRRAALSILATAPKPLPEAALARVVAVRTADGEPVEIDDDAMRSVRVALHHCDLPKLEDVGLVDRDVGERAVDATDRGCELVREVLNGDEDAGATSATGGRLPILSSIATLDAPVGLRPLADALVDDHEAWDDSETAATRLHHVDLPRLEDAGLLSYDAADRRIEVQSDGDAGIVAGGRG